MALMQLQGMSHHAHSSLTGVLASYPAPQQLIDAVISKRSFKRKFGRGKAGVVVCVENGLIVGFSGSILDSDEVFTMETAISYLMSKGISYEDGLQTIKTGLLQTLLTFSKTDSFEPDTSNLGRAFPLPLKLGDDLANVLKSLQVEEDLLRTFGPALGEHIVWTPLKFDVVDIKLSLQLLKDYRKMNGAKTIREAVDVDNRVTDYWRSLDIFMSMGLVEIHSASQETDVQVDMERLKELEALLDSIRQQPAYVTFGLTAPNEVHDQHIGQVFRELSKKYHPDRFGKVSTVEHDLILEVYAQINDLYAELQNEEVRVELKKRLDVERRGLQYVSDLDAKKAELLQAQGLFFFRKRRYEEALVELDSAFKLNPYNWRTNTMRIRCQAELGQISKREAADILADNKEARGSDRVDLLFQAGEFYLKDGVENRAYELFSKVVELDAGHIDAKRYLHLRKRQSKEVESEEAAAEKGSFFSRLFGKK